VLLDTATGKFLGTVKAGPSHCLSDRAAYRAGGADKPDGMAVYRRHGDRPLFVLVLDVVPTSVVFQFHPNAKEPQLAWGNIDGSVLVANLKEVEEHLIAAGLENTP
jgi:hypothetical protein